MRQKKRKAERIRKTMKTILVNKINIKNDVLLSKKRD